MLTKKDILFFVLIEKKRALVAEQIVDPGYEKALAAARKVIRFNDVADDMNFIRTAEIILRIGNEI